MPLFLVTRLCHHGMSDQCFRVVEAPSRLAVVESMKRNPYRWSDFLHKSYLWDVFRDGRWTASELLQRVDRSTVDGDSRYQLAIHEITRVENVSDADEWVGPISVFS
jgi:hypothetical protein